MKPVVVKETEIMGVGLGTTNLVAYLTDMNANTEALNQQLQDIDTRLKTVEAAMSKVLQKLALKT